MSHPHAAVTASDLSSVASSRDGKYIASGSHDHTVKVWDAERGTEILSLQGHTQWISSVAFSPDGQHLFSGSHDGTVKMWPLYKKK